MSAIADEDAKLITLARGARARIGADQGAALRDEMGRTYASANVNLPSLRLSALQVCLAQAVSAGASGVEAAAIVTDDDVAIDSAFSEFAGSGVRIYLCEPDGSIRSHVVS
jgi:cytidine deaminase